MSALYGYEWLEARLGVKRATLASWVSRGRIPHVRLGDRLVRFDEAEIEAWLGQRRVAVGERRRHRNPTELRAVGGDGR